MLLNEAAHVEETATQLQYALQGNRNFRELL
jgi:hypothetical protein